MKRKLSLWLPLLAALVVLAFSSFDKGGKKKPLTGHKKIAGGSYFRLVKKGTGTLSADTGGAVFVKMKFKTIDDSVFIDINEASKTASYPLRLEKPAYKGDFFDVFATLHKGDSISLFLRMDSLKKYYPKEFEFDPRYDTMKYVGFALSVDSIYSKKQVEALRAKITAEQQAKQQQQQSMAMIMQPIQDNAKKKEPGLKKQDAALLDLFFKLNTDYFLLPGSKGIYMKTIFPGSGPNLAKGVNIGVRYTGRYLDGTIFDSNEFVPGQELLSFQLGDPSLIAGFTQCLYQMKAGGRASMLIPPSAAYNDSLTRVFEVQVISVH